jgi:hypothetical protein
MNRQRQQDLVDLAGLIGRHSAWGTAEGTRVFADLNVRLLPLSDGTVVRLNFQGLDLADASFLREAVVETIRKHRPRLLFVAEGLTDVDILANLEMALDKRGECLINRGTHRSKVLGRKLSAEEARALATVEAEGELTSKDLRASGEDTAGAGGKERKGLKASTASSRLAALWRAGLIERTEGVAESGGREYRYYAIQ